MTGSSSICISLKAASTAIADNYLKISNGSSAAFFPEKQQCVKLTILQTPFSHTLR